MGPRWIKGVWLGAAVCAAWTGCVTSSGGPGAGPGPEFDSGGIGFEASPGEDSAAPDDATMPSGDSAKPPEDSTAPVDSQSAADSGQGSMDSGQVTLDSGQGATDSAGEAAPEAGPHDASADAAEASAPCACSGTDVCVDGGCVACGALGGPCCTSGPACDAVTLACAGGTCTTCGGSGEPCCGSAPLCSAGFACASGTCSCGGYDQPCCTGNTCDNANLVCAGGSCTCGAPQQVCCVTGTGGATSVCAPTGGATASCAPGGLCSCLTACSNGQNQRSDGTLWDPDSTNTVTTNGTTPLVATGFSGSGNILGCAIDASGAPWCWGPDNNLGQLGRGNTTSPAAPDTAARVLTSVGDAGSAPLTGITKIAVDGRQGYAACAIDTNTNLWCWGCPNFAQSGTYSTYATKVSTASGALTGVVAVAVGEFHSCAVKNDGTLWCWGANDSGQLGTGDTSGAAQPLAVQVTYFPTNSLQVASVAVGASGFGASTFGVTCATTTADTVYCWGSDATGALEGAISNTTYAYSPQPIVTSSGGPALANVTSVQIISGNASPCVTTSSGSVLCWGEMPKLAAWAAPANVYYPSPYQEGGSFPSILSMCSITGYGNSATPGMTFLDTSGIFHRGGEAYNGVGSPQPITCGP
jgi:alpha-tubulin suppressor-like RCC1 family protein